ncbi:MAG: formylmethanofuran dehydrogenase subunit E family protein [Candidatus Nezhaarchaeota archaeon]|nr:formylmethanofuran dehydrogenase subunit E family protein [Candidatus Nezhaarchaeota archaeon]
MTPLTLEGAIRFHGLPCPWLVLGCRAGLRAVEAMDNNNLRYGAKLSTKKPYACLMDSTQASDSYTL